MVIREGVWKVSRRCIGGDACVGRGRVVRGESVFTSSNASNASHATRMKIQVVKEPREIFCTICITFTKMATYHVRRVAS